jgi:hypothetical protein
LAIVDEVAPKGAVKALAFYALRWPMALVTWLLTRTSTRPVAGISDLLGEQKLRAVRVEDRLAGSLALWVAWKADDEAQGNMRSRPASAPDGALVGQGDLEPKRLRRRVTAVTVLEELWGLFFRVIPPYPRVPPGLYYIGAPTRDSALLATGNFALTVRRLVRALDGRVDVWLLVVDSAGVNVWCGAGGGFLTADKVVAAARRSRVAEIVSHRALVLPQLCANGVDGDTIRRELGWGVHWGPVRASDIPAYLTAGGRKSDRMRLVAFPLRDRLEMVSATLGLYALLILVPVFIFWREVFVPVGAALLALSYFYAIVMPWLPGRDGLAKSVPLALIAIAGMSVYSAWFSPTDGHGVFSRAIGLTALSVFVAAELQGMSPRMRGEQANWTWEAVIGLVLLAVYLVVPRILGWS